MVATRGHTSTHIGTYDRSRFEDHMLLNHPLVRRDQCLYALLEIEVDELRGIPCADRDGQHPEKNKRRE